MPITWLFQEPLNFLVWILAVIVALTIHEFAHAYSAYAFGDDTARRFGRITLNPLAHLDPIGFIMLVFIGFGWAKPVQIDPLRLKNPRVSSALVALAGPLANLLGIIVFGIALKILAPILGPANLLVNFLFMLVVIDTILMIFNLIPIPPLDGSHILFSLLPDRFDRFKEQLMINGPFVLLALILIDNFTGISIFGRLFSGFLNLITRFLG